MKEYVQLYIDVTAFYSGNTYYEEVYLPKEKWEKIKHKVPMHTFITELDGKHSEVKAEIEVAEMTESFLTTYQSPEGNDGDTLFYHIEEYLYSDTYDNEYLQNIQKEVHNLSQVESLTIKINKNQKEEVLKLLEGYLV